MIRIISNFCLSLLLCSLSFLATSQTWNTVFSGTNEDLNSVHFANDTVGFIAGNNGVLLKTYDGGDSWIDVFNLDTTSLLSVHAIDEDTLYVGGIGKLYKSIDGGSTFTDLNRNDYVSKVYFVNAQHGYYFKKNSVFCASSQDPTGGYWHYHRLYETRDYGLTWSSVIISNGSFDRPEIQFTSDSIGYIVAPTIDQPWPHCGIQYGFKLLKTEDAGLTWQANPSYTAISGWSSNASYLNDSVGYYLGYNKIIKTTNGGDSIISTNSNSYNIIYASFNNYNFINISNFHFFNEIDGYFTYQNKIYKSSNNGVLWQADYVSTTLNSAYYSDSSYSYVVGDQGAIIRNSIYNSIPYDSSYQLYVNPPNHNFGNTSIGLDGLKEFNILNNGNANLTLMISAPPGFTLKLEGGSFYDTIIGPFNLNIQHDTSILIRFIPDSIQNYTDQVIINVNNKPPKHINVTGNGIAELTGDINNDYTICADTVHVTGDVTVKESATLTICPGTVIEFMGYYQFSVFGKILANGLADDSIVFTTINESIGWKGIKYRSLNTDTSIFEYCKIEKSKETGIEIANSWIGTTRTNATLSINHSEICNNRNSGIVGVNTKMVIIENSSIHDNNATFGGGIYIRNTETKIHNNKIYNNYANSSGGGIYMFESYVTSESIVSQNLIFNNYASYGGGIACIEYSPLISQNVICYNRATYGGGISCQGSFYPSSPKVRNCIIYDNSTYQIYKETNREPKSKPSFRYCNIEDGGFGNFNISANPQFVKPTNRFFQIPDSLEYDWSLLPNSPCIDAGKNSINGNAKSKFDFLGNKRVLGSAVDIGAYESRTKPSAIIDSCGINGVTLTANVYDSSFTGFQWFFNESTIQGATNSNLTIIPYSQANNGKYSCDVYFPLDTIIGFQDSIQLDNTFPYINSQSDSIQAIKLGDSIQLFVNVENAASYQWYLNDTTLNNQMDSILIIPLVSISDTGSYHCEIRNECDTIVSKKMRLMLSVGLSSNLLHEKISIYPNPTKGIFTIDNLKHWWETVEIFDMTGKLLFSKRIVNNTIDISKFSDGSYILSIKNGKNTVVGRQIIIKK